MKVNVYFENTELGAYTCYVKKIFLYLLYLVTEIRLKMPKRICLKHTMRLPKFFNQKEKNQQN